MDAAPGLRQARPATRASGWSGRASAFGQYFFYGDDLSNHVQYLGNELRRGTFRQIDECQDFREVVNEGDYDYIVVTPRIRRETSIPPEVFWVGDDPNAKAATCNSGQLAGVFADRRPARPRDLRPGREALPRRPRRSRRSSARAEAEALLEALPPDEREEAREALEEQREREPVSFGDYLAGAIEMLVVLAALGYGAVRLRGRLLDGWSGAPRAARRGRARPLAPGRRRSS